MQSSQLGLRAFSTGSFQPLNAASSAHWLVQQAAAPCLLSPGYVWALQWEAGPGPSPPHGAGLGRCGHSLGVRDRAAPGSPSVWNEAQSPCPSALMLMDSLCSQPLTSSAWNPPPSFSPTRCLSCAGASWTQSGACCTAPPGTVGLLQGAWPTQACWCRFQVFISHNPAFLPPLSEPPAVTDSPRFF